MLLSSTEIECSVKGYDGAVFQSCSSPAEGNIKFRLFAERVGQMFAGSDPFSGITGMMSRPEGCHEATPQPVSSVPSIPKRSELLLTPKVAESSKAASKYKPSGSSHVSPLQDPKVCRPGDGWYVVHNAVLPGVYYGM